MQQKSAANTTRLGTVRRVNSSTRSAWSTYVEEEEDSDDDDHSYDRNRNVQQKKNESTSTLQSACSSTCSGETRQGGRTNRSVSSSTCSRDSKRKNQKGIYLLNRW